RPLRLRRAIGRRAGFGGFSFTFSSILNLPSPLERNDRSFLQGPRSPDKPGLKLAAFFNPEGAENAEKTGTNCNDHCEAAGFQVTPPSEVSKTFVLARFQMVAWRASVARMPPKSSSRGEWIVAQCAPPSVVSRMVPARPTIQQTFSEGAEPAVRSANTLLVCRSQEPPSSAENSIMPAWP